MEKDLIEIARIKGPHGLKGKMWIIPYGDSFERFSGYTHLIIGNQGVQRKLLSCTQRKGKYIIELEGITHIDLVDKIKNESIYVKREQLEQLQDDEYYWNDLLGMHVVDTDGKALGELVNIFPTGSNDVFVVDKVKQFYIPVTKDVIKEISLEKRTIVVDTSLLEGLLE